MITECVGVVGCGVMGAGIAQLCAQKGYQVVVLEKDRARLEKGLATIEAAFYKLAANGKLSEDQMTACMAAIQGTTDIEQFASCDLVIEAVTEKMEFKKKIFSTLDRVCASHAILATNTSVLSVIEIAQATSRAEKVLGMHFLTPPPVIKLLEVVRTVLTGKETLNAVLKFGARIGKKVVVSKDTPGFIVNRVLTSILFNAVRLYEQGVASKEDIDTAMVKGLGLPMGPFALLDLIGMDTIVLGSNALFEELNDSQYFCPITIRRMVAAGHLGRKTGKGFYEY